MSASSVSYVPPYADDLPEPRRILYAGVTALLVLVGLAIAFSISVPLIRGTVPDLASAVSSWDWVIGVIAIVLVFVVVFSIVRLVLWGIWGAEYSGAGRHYYRHYYRHYFAGLPMGWDPAIDVARQRFARGEITEEQYLQMVRQLSGSPPPGAGT